jgi:hypothetical protein
MLQAAEARAVPAAMSAGGAPSQHAAPDMVLPMSAQANASMRSNATPYGDGDLSQGAGAVPGYGLVDAQIAQLMHPQVRITPWHYVGMVQLCPC